MKIAIRYFSRTGITKKLANAIGEQLNVVPRSLKEALEDDVDLLFLGSALYALNIDNHMKKFIDSLSPSSTLKVVCFSTTAVLTSSYSVLSRHLSRNGIGYTPENFHCYGAFGALHKKHPDEIDLNAVSKFAKKIVKQYKDS